MTFDEYQKAARATAIYPRQHAITYPALGLGGESGEVEEKIKKFLRDGTLDKEAVKKEMGDVLWYLANLACDLDLTFESIAQANVAKLKSR